MAGIAVPAKPKPMVAKAEPDLVWRMKSSYDLPSDGDDQYRCFVIPTGNDAARFIDGFEFLPGNRRVVHHALLFFDLSGAGRKLDAEADGAGYPCFGSPGFFTFVEFGWLEPRERAAADAAADGGAGACGGRRCVSNPLSSDRQA